jgi:hypothetical protein
MLTPTERRNRERMLQKVRDFWIKGVLEHSLYGAALIDLRLAYKPWRYARFLDYCVERIFLRKVGGGYIFVHRMLMEYFAALETRSPDAPNR